MDLNLTHRKAEFSDLSNIISLLTQDELGKKREQFSYKLDQRYIDAFNKINNDQNQYIMVVEFEKYIVGTCHLTFIPSLTFIGATRMNIEAVRVDINFRGKNIGKWMINEAINYGKSQGANIVQLTTNKIRVSVLEFYKKLGFENSHEGLKLYLRV